MNDQGACQPRTSEDVNHNRAIPPFIREKINRGLQKTRMFTLYKWYKIYVHVFFKPRLILTWEYIFVLIVPFAYFVHRGQSKPGLIFSCIKGPNIARPEKHQSIVHVERTCEVLSCSIVSCQIGRKVGTSFFVEEKVSVFTTNLSMSKFLSVFNERNYILQKKRALQYKLSLPFIENQ